MVAELGKERELALISHGAFQSSRPCFRIDCPPCLLILKAGCLRVSLCCSLRVSRGLEVDDAFWKFSRNSIVPSGPGTSCAKITLGKTMILRLLELFDRGCIFSCNSTRMIEHRRLGTIFASHTS